LGAEKVLIVYRRSFEEMPAHVPEIGAAREEGVEFLILATPTKILGRKRVESLECVKMKLGPPDESGRRKPIPIEGSEFKLDVDVVIEAIGQKVDEEFVRENPDIKVSKGSIVADAKTGMASKPGVFAGGDAVRGGTVVQAIAEGKLAAKGIDEYLKRGSK
jgi:glutamate synthase (NADPH/NADH) small chain